MCYLDHTAYLLLPSKKLASDIILSELRGRSSKFLYLTRSRFSRKIADTSRASTKCQHYSARLERRLTTRASFNSEKREYFGHILMPGRFSAASKIVDATVNAGFQHVAHKCNQVLVYVMSTEGCSNISSKWLDCSMTIFKRTKTRISRKKRLRNKIP